jgi:hypothetical protein
MSATPKETLDQLFIELIKMLAAVSSSLAAAAAAGVSGDIIARLECRLASIERTVRELAIAVAIGRALPVPQSAGRHLRSC